MTPPLRPTWTDLDHLNLAGALADAAVRARQMEQPHVVVARIEQNVLGFDVMLLASYTGLQATSNAKYIAQVALVMPDGTRSIDPALSPTEL